MDPLDLLVCGAVLEKQDQRVLLVNLGLLALQVPLAILLLLLVISWGTMMRTCQTHFQSLQKTRQLQMTQTKLTLESILP